MVDLCAAPGSWSQVSGKRLAILLASSLFGSNDQHEVYADAAGSRCCGTPRVQVLSRRLYLPAAAAGRSGAELPKIVAVDLQPMAPIEGVTQLQVRACLQLGHTLSAAIRLLCKPQPPPNSGAAGRHHQRGHSKGGHLPF